MRQSAARLLPLRHRDIVFYSMSSQLEEINDKQIDIYSVFSQSPQL